MNLTPKDLAMLATIDAQFPALRAFLKTRFDGYVDIAIQTADVHALQMARGRAAELKDLIRLLDLAKDQRSR